MDDSTKSAMESALSALKVVGVSPVTAIPISLLSEQLGKQDTAVAEELQYQVDFSKLYSHPLAIKFHEMVQIVECLGCSPEITDAVNRLHALKVEVAAAINITPSPEAIDALQACEDYFANRSDADCDQDGFVPNKEMELLSAVQAALAPFKGTDAA